VLDCGNLTAMYRWFVLLEKDFIYYLGCLRAFSSFSALMLLVGQQEGHWACECNAATVPKT